jgi:hypothetical protein
MTTTMTYFTNGKFGTGPKPEGWDSGWTSAEDIGYEAAETYGVPCAPVLTLYARLDDGKAGPGYLVTLSDGDACEWIGAASLRDAMDLLARWAPVATASAMSCLASILAGPDDEQFLPRLIGRIRADEQDGTTERAEDEILAARREQRKAWLAAQAEPEPEAGAEPVAETAAAE